MKPLHTLAGGSDFEVPWHMACRPGNGDSNEWDINNMALLKPEANEVENFV